MRLYRRREYLGTAMSCGIQSAGRRTDHDHVCLPQVHLSRKIEQSGHGLQTRGGRLGRPVPVSLVFPRVTS